ncbi:hypothetical protein [Paraburkholderia sp.]|jgi:hypothetical protein|uniref:hypothetical protein n=1 Tax=Paraburkholderia sp. TaxID=1926495 RepID=UPI003C7EB598
MTRKKLKLADLLARYDPSPQYAGEVWAKAQPIGREFGAPGDDAGTPLGRLRGTVQRYDSPTDPVWPLNDESWRAATRVMPSVKLSTRLQ